MKLLLRRPDSWERDRVEQVAQPRGGEAMSEIGSIDPWGRPCDRGGHVIGSPENLRWQANIDIQNRDWASLFERARRRETLRAWLWVLLFVGAVLLLSLTSCARPVKPADPARRDPQTYTPPPKNVITTVGTREWLDRQTPPSLRNPRQRP
jgi:hypothetical protein